MDQQTVNNEVKQIPLKYKLGAGAAALLVSFAFGRYTVPEKIKIETKVVEVEKKTSEQDKDKEKHKKTTTKEIKKPDGTVETVTETTEDTINKSKDKQSEDSKKVDIEHKEEEKGQSNTTLSVLGGIDIVNPAAGIDYGLSIYRPVLGPIGLGVYGFQSKTVGVSLGVSF